MIYSDHKMNSSLLVLEDMGWYPYAYTTTCQPRLLNRNNAGQFCWHCLGSESILARYDKVTGMWLAIGSVVAGGRSLWRVDRSPAKQSMTTGNIWMGQYVPALGYNVKQYKQVVSIDQTNKAKQYLGQCEANHVSTWSCRWPSTSGKNEYPGCAILQFDTWVKP